MPPSSRRPSSPPPEEDIYGASPVPQSARRAFSHVRQQPQTTSISSDKELSPTTSNSSDKENAASRGASSNKGKGRAADMPPPKLPTPLSSEGERNGKRTRQTDSDPNPRRSQRPRASTEAEDMEEVEATQFYDPDQNPEERRQVRKGLRDLATELNENRAEYFKRGSTGFYDTLTRQNVFFNKVKQTSDATIDSRLLVTTADLSYRQTCQLSLGDSVQGVDIDEFVSKCITFMRSGGEAQDPPRTQRSSTQTRRRRTNNHYDEDGEDDNGDELDWAHLGSLACLPYNSRPSVPGFLLGPLSLEKKARKPVQRTARLKPSQYVQTQPVTLKVGDLHKDEQKNLIFLTKMIHKSLIRNRRERYDKVEAIKQRHPNMSPSEVKKLMESNGLLFPLAGLNLWQFVINPRSFGQTVENIFYVSFLIRDGKARLSPDDDGQIGLFPAEAGNHEEERSKNSTKYQGIISIDMADWSTLIELYDIKESMIEHRDDDDEGVGGGWVS